MDEFSLIDRYFSPLQLERADIALGIGDDAAVLDIAAPGRIVVAVDIALIHFMQKANFNLAIERERSRTLAENRELLFHELQHRVSNNLQVVAAMIDMRLMDGTSLASRPAKRESRPPRIREPAPIREWWRTAATYTN